MASKNPGKLHMKSCTSRYIYRSAKMDNEQMRASMCSISLSETTSGLIPTRKDDRVIR